MEHLVAFFINFKLFLTLMLIRKYSFFLKRMEIIFLIVIFSIRIFIFKHIHTYVCLLVERAFSLALIIFHIIQPYPGGMGNYFIKITSEQLQLILRWNDKATQPPCFGSFAFDRSFLGKLLLRPYTSIQCRSWFWMGRFRFPQISQSQPGAQVLLRVWISLNGWRTGGEAWKGLWSLGERSGRACKVLEPICC